MTTTTDSMTAAEIIAAADAAAAARDGKGLAALLSAAAGLDSLADSKAIETRMTAWRTVGSVYIAAVVVHTDGAADLHTVSQADVAAAVAAVIGKDVDKDTAKKRVRAALYCTPEAVSKASDAYGKADGPASLNGADILRWCQARDSKGRAALAGKKGSVPTAADAKKAASKAAADARKAASKAAADASKAEALTTGQAILTADSDDVFGPLSAGRWQALDLKALEQLADLTAGVIAAKKAADAAAKKAAAAAKKAADKGSKKASKTEAPPMSADMQAIVDAAVAAALAAAQG